MRSGHGGSDDDGYPFGVLVGATNGSNGCGCGGGAGAHVDEEDLVLGVFDEAIEFNAKLDELAVVELALKDGELEVLPPAKHGFVDFAKALGIANVIGDDVGVTHEFYPRSGRALRFVRASESGCKARKWVARLLREISECGTRDSEAIHVGGRD